MSKIDRGIASVTGGTDNDKSLQVFSITENQNLSFLLKTQGSSNNEETIIAAKTALPGHVVRTSQLGCIDLHGVKYVFGFTEHPGDKSVDTTFVDISIVSPAYQPLFEADIENKSVAGCLVEDEPYIYYTTGKEQNMIQECYNPKNNLEWRMGQKLSLDPCAKKQSSLAAYYDADEKKRYVICQSTKGTLVDYSVGDNKSVPISAVGNAHPESSLAVTYIPKQKKAFLYYTTKDKKLSSIVKNEGAWSVHKTSLPSVDESSQISVTTLGDVNYLFYIEEGAKDIAKHTDDTRPVN